MRRLLLVAFVAACGDGSPGDGETAADLLPVPPGVALIEIPAQALRDLPEWVISAEPLITLGLADGEAPYLFFRIQAAARLAGGGFLVGDGQSRELRVFDREGRFVQRFGGHGEGPGEFRAWQLLSPVADDRIAVVDPVLSRVTVYDLADGLVSTAPLPSPPCDDARLDAREGRCDVVAAWPDGRLLTLRTQRPPASADPLRTDELVFRPAGTSYYALYGGATFHVLDSLPTSAGVSYREGFVGRDVPAAALPAAGSYWSSEALYTPGGVVAVAAEAVAFARSDRFEIRLYTGDGSLSRVIRGALPAQPVTGALLASHRRWADTAQRSNAPAREYLRQLEPEGVVPYFGQLRIDRAGRLWLEDYRPPSFLGPPQPRRWTVLAPDGRPLARLEEARRFEILELGADYALVAASDELGVERVALFGIEPAGLR